MYRYVTTGTCSREIVFNITDNKITDISFVSGCNGNLKGIGALAEGMDIDDVIEKLKGIRCGTKPTSCPDQLAEALQKYKALKIEQAQ